MIDEIRKRHNEKEYYSLDGNVKTLKELTNDKFRDEKAYIKKLETIFNSNPMELTLDEIEELRKNKNKSSDIKLKFDNQLGGFVMVTSESNRKNIIRSLSDSAGNALVKMMTYMNKDGILVYDSNSKPIQNLEELRDLLLFSDRKWRKIMLELKSFDLIKKIIVEHKNSYIIINPFFMSKSYNINEIKFISFYELFREKLDDLDYYYLCKKFEINP